MKKVQNPYLYETDYFDNKSAEDLFNDSDAVGIDSKEYAHSFGGYRLTIKFETDNANNDQLFRRMNTYLENDKNILHYSRETFEHNIFASRVVKCPMWRIVLQRCAAVQILDLCWHLFMIARKFGAKRYVVIEEDDYIEEDNMWMAAEDGPSNNNNSHKLYKVEIGMFGSLLFFLKDNNFVNFSKENNSYFSNYINAIIQMGQFPGRNIIKDDEFSDCFAFVVGNYFNRKFENSFHRIMKRNNNFWETTITFNFIPNKQKSKNDVFKKQLKVICRSKIDYIFKMNLIDIIIRRLQFIATSFDYHIDSSVEMSDCINPYIKVNYENHALDNLMQMLDWRSKQKVKPNNEYYFLPMSDTKLSFKNNLDKTFNRLADFTKATDLEYISNLI